MFKYGESLVILEPDCISNSVFDNDRATRQQKQ